MEEIHKSRLSGWNTWLMGVITGICLLGIVLTVYRSKVNFFPVIIDINKIIRQQATILATAGHRDATLQIKMREFNTKLQEELGSLPKEWLVLNPSMVIRKDNIPDKTEEFLETLMD